MDPLQYLKKIFNLKSWFVRGKDGVTSKDLIHWKNVGYALGVVGILLLFSTVYVAIQDDKRQDEQGSRFKSQSRSHGDVHGFESLPQTGSPPQVDPNAGNFGRSYYGSSLSLRAGPFRNPSMI